MIHDPWFAYLVFGTKAKLADYLAAANWGLLTSLLEPRQSTVSAGVDQVDQFNLERSRTLDLGKADSANESTR